MFREVLPQENLASNSQAIVSPHLQVPIFPRIVILFEVITILGLQKYAVFAQEKAHFVVEEDLHSIVGEQKQGGILTTAVLCNCNEAFFFRRTSLGSLQSLLEGLQDMDLLADFLLLGKLIMRIDYFRPLATPLPCADLLLIARRVKVLRFVIEDEANQPRIHLVPEA